MECFNCLVKPLNEFPTSNMLDNFEHTKCGELLPEHHNENKISSDTKEKQDNDYCDNCYSSLWVRSCEEEVIEPLRSTNITGSIPKWLEGTLLRNGPGNLKVGEYYYQHLFDSSALLHKFEIVDGEVTYQRRFVQTEVYKRNQAAQRIVFNEFGTYASPDPCHSIFRRVATVFNSSKSMSDNSMISVYPFGDEYYTFTETPVMHRIDPKTLETTGKINVSQYVNIVNHTSHPHVMVDGTVYNVGLSVTSRGPQYNVVCFSSIGDSEKKQKLSMFDHATIVASVPSRWLLNPSYMHTFGITENYFIIVEQPLAMSFIKMTMNRIKQEPMINSLKWHENENTLIHVISRKTGQTIRTFVAETFFYFHIINQFETRDGEYVVLDICCYRNAKLLDYWYIESLKSINRDIEFAKLSHARPLRFVLPMRQPPTDTLFEDNLITIKTVHQSLKDHDLNLQIIDSQNSFSTDEYFNETKCQINEQKSVLWKKPVAHLLSDGRIFVRPELLCDIGCEIPRINTNSYLGSEYRYFYAISGDMDVKNYGTLIKVDTYRKTKKIWQEKGVYPSEPIFVPNPTGKNEDDGVVVSSLIWRDEETRVGLLILDAVTFMEIARATFDTPGPVPKCLHGWFSPNK